MLLVDDEEDIRVGISRKMDWAALGFSLVGEAENGREALELAETLEPDVVLTDIKMPFMDGLELCRILTERLPAAKFVVFSGFDEFEYAKQAIRMNVFEYILKPISAAELEGVLRRLRERLDAERAERQNTEALRRRYEESLPVLRELFYAHLLEGRVPPEQAAERAARLELDITGDAWTAALSHVDGGPDRELAALSVQQLLEENLTLEGWSCRTFLYGDTAAALAVSRGGGSVYALIQALDRVCALAESYLGLTLTVGVGAPCAGLGGLPQSAEGALAALDYRGLVGAGRAIYIGDLEPDAGARISFDENDERELAGAVRPPFRSRRQPVQPLFSGAAHLPSAAGPGSRAGGGGGVRHRLYRRGAGHGLLLLHGHGGVVPGAVPADSDPASPPEDGFRRTDRGAGQGLYPGALRGERPLRGAAVRSPPPEPRLFLHPL